MSKLKPHIWYENGRYYCGMGPAHPFAYAGPTAVCAYAARAHECITGPYLTMFIRFK